MSAPGKRPGLRPIFVAGEAGGEAGGMPALIRQYQRMARYEREYRELEPWRRLRQARAEYAAVRHDIGTISRIAAGIRYRRALVACGLVVR